MNARLSAGSTVAIGAILAAGAAGAMAAVSPLIAAGAVVAIIFVYIAFTDLAAGFAVLVLLSFIATLPTSGSLSAAKGAGFLIAIAWLARLASEWRTRRDFLAEHGRLAWLMVAFLVWASITMLWADSTGASLTALSRYAPNMLLVPIGFTAVRTRRDLWLVLAAAIVGAAVAAAFAVFQPTNPKFVEEGGRASGTIGDPNELAAVLLAGLAIAVAGLRGWGTRFRLVRLIAMVAAPLCVLGVFLSLSRGGLVAFGVMLVAGAVIGGRWRSAIAAMLVVLAAGGALYFTQVASVPARERISKAGNGTGRLDLWTVGWRMARAHPFTGVGIGNFQNLSARYALLPGEEVHRADLIFSKAPKVTHNTYLETLAEAGVPGVLLYLLVIGGCLRAALQAADVWSARGDPAMEALARGVALGLVAMFAADFFITDPYNKLLWSLLALGPAMLALARGELQDAGERRAHQA